MKSSQDDIDLLNSYLKGRLGSADAAALQERLSIDSELYSDFQDLKNIQEGIRISVLKDKLEMMKKWENEVIIKPKENWGKWILFTFLIILLGYFLYSIALKSKQEVPEEYKTLYASDFDKSLILHSTKRSINQVDTLSGTQKRAYEMYSIQLFDDAIPVLNELWVGQKDTLALFYLGVSHIGVGDKKQGLEILQKPELIKYSEQTNLFLNH